MVCQDDTADREPRWEPDLERLALDLTGDRAGQG